MSQMFVFYSAKVEVFQSIFFYINTRRMTDKNRSYLTPYNIFLSRLYVQQTKMHLPKRPVMVFRLKEVAHALPLRNSTNLTSYPNSWI